MFNKILITILLFLCTTFTYAENTKRIPQFSNHRVTVWETDIYPGNAESLKFHRHDQDRVFVALTSGKLKYISNNGHTKIISFEKDKVYYFPRNPPGELHKEINIGNNVLKIMVIALN